MNKYSFTVDELSSGNRIDKFLSQQFLTIKPEITRSKIQNLIAKQQVFVNQKIVDSDSQKIKVNEKINIHINLP